MKLAPCALVLFVACSDGPKAAAPPPQPPPVVTVGKPERRPVQLESELIGRTFARDVVRVVPRVAGVITAVRFVEGTSVKAGDVLFEIDRAPYETTLAATQARLAQDRATLVKVKRDLERMRGLLEQAAVSRAEVDALQASVAVTEAAIRADQAAVDRAELDVGYTTIAAPIGGVIGELQVTAGNYVAPGQATPLATLSSVDPMYVSFAMPEATWLSLRRQKGDLSTLAPTLILADGKPYDQPGRVDFVDPAVDPTTGTLTVRAAYPNAEGFLKPGQFARVRFVSESVADALLVPRIALGQTQSQRTVWVVGPDQKVAMKPVGVGREVGDQVIITSGLTGDETIVVEGTGKLRPGIAVAPKAPSAPATPPPSAPATPPAAPPSSGGR